MDEKLKICIVLATSAANGQVAPEDQALAAMSAELAKRGHEVVVVGTGHRAGWAAKKSWPVRVRYVFLDLTLWSHLEYPRHSCGSYAVFQWLRNSEPFDLVIFTEWNATGFYSLVGKHQGLAFGTSRMVICASGPTAMRREASLDFLTDCDILERQFMERRCVEYADILLASTEVIEFMQRERWHLSRQIQISASRGDGASPEVFAADWIDGLDRAFDQIRDAIADGAASDTPPPSISVCITHFNRPLFLAQQLESLRKQEIPPIEVLVVDDGSTNDDALTYLKSLDSDFKTIGWKVIYQPNKYLGAARNTGVRHARGDYVLFLDDDDYAQPSLVRVFGAVAAKTHADIITCGTNLFRSIDPPQLDDRPWRLLIFPGAAIAAGALRNVFGPSSALVKKSAFEVMGGFSEIKGVGSEDWELYARAVLAGYQLESIPIPLFWYRIRPGSMARSTQFGANLRRGLSPFLEVTRPELRETLLFLHGYYYAHLNKRDGILKTLEKKARAMRKQLLGRIIHARRGR